MRIRYGLSLSAALLVAIAVPTTAVAVVGGASPAVARVPAVPVTVTCNSNDSGNSNGPGGIGSLSGAMTFTADPAAMLVGCTGSSSKAKVTPEAIWSGVPIVTSTDTATVKWTNNKTTTLSFSFNGSRGTCPTFDGLTSENATPGAIIATVTGGTAKLTVGQSFSFVECFTGDVSVPELVLWSAGPITL